MKEKLEKYVGRVIQNLKWPSVPVVFETPKQKERGDFATNVAFLLAKEIKKNPREIAQNLVEGLQPLPDWIQKAEVAGAGFINFSLKPAGFFEGLRDIFKKKKKYGTSTFGKKKKVILEFVSANPTGPLNVVSARSAAVGDTLANLLEAVGFKPYREYYVNDVGRQIELFAQSISARYNQALGQEASIPEEGYQGEYLKTFAEGLARKNKKRKPTLESFKKEGLRAMIDGQKKSLKNFGVVFDNWYLQSKLVNRKIFLEALKRLAERGYCYEREGALFFKSTVFGDDKDRVIRKKDGDYSYFASDIAYHDDKFKRGFDRAIDLLGPDHHGYMARTKAAVEALGHDPRQLLILIVQQVNLVKGEEILKMSKRAGKLITMDDLLSAVGKDVARYFFLQRSSSAHLDFDLGLAQKETPENPVFYIQYAHARIASIFNKALENNIRLDPKRVSLEFLDLPEEKELAKQLLHFPDLIAQAAQALEPHLLAFYCLDLARLFQTYYSQAKNDPRYRVVDSAEPGKTNAKLYLLKNIQIVLQNGLRLMGISAPERMERETNVAGTLQ